MKPTTLPLRVFAFFVYLKTLDDVSREYGVAKVLVFASYVRLCEASYLCELRVLCGRLVVLHLEENR